MSAQRPRINYGDGAIRPDPLRPRQPTSEDRTLWWLAGGIALLIALIVLSRISFGGTTEIRQLNVGDCFSYESGRNVTRVTRMSCADAHGAEAFARLDVGQSNGKTECTEQWNDFMGAVAPGMPAEIEIQALKIQTTIGRFDTYSGRVICAAASPSNDLPGPLFPEIDG